MKDGNRFPTSSILQWDHFEYVYRDQEKEVEIKKGKCWDMIWEKGAYMIVGTKFALYWNNLNTFNRFIENYSGQGTALSRNAVVKYA